MADYARGNILFADVGIKIPDAVGGQPNDVDLQPPQVLASSDVAWLVSFDTVWRLRDV